MFTGIVQGTARVAQLSDRPGLRCIRLEFAPGFAEGLAAGASVSVDGTCLTVTAVHGGHAADFDVMQQTLALTTLGALAPGSRVNVERAAKDGAEIGGHLLSGHVDFRAHVAEVRQPENNHILRLVVPAPWMRYVFAKGYIAVNGASLTVAEAERQADGAPLRPAASRHGIRFQHGRRSRAAARNRRRRITAGRHADDRRGSCDGRLRTFRQRADPEARIESAVNVSMGTLSKAMGSYGGFVACSPRMRELFVNRARALIYTTALPPSVIAASIAALEIMQTSPELGAELLKRAESFRKTLKAAGLDTLQSASQIIPIVVGENAKALALAERLRASGILAVAIRPPTVPQGSARLRLSITLDHSENDLARAAEIIIAAAKAEGVI